MKRFSPIIIAVTTALVLATPAARAWNEQYTALQNYFERDIKERYAKAFEGIQTVQQWEKRREEIKHKLLAALGHDRPWPAEPPKAQVTHQVERDSYRLECLILETAPGVYITANLYIPRQGDGPFPVVLYQSGHSPRGPYGNKDAFKHHGAWFAARGIAVIIMDTIEMGELTVTHHGLYYNHWYDWLSRGYSPLAMELFNARRVLDYLTTRPEIDMKRVGATGISGGGVTTFFITAIDDRIAAGAEVSGVCSSVGHVEGRLAVEHCDCMYPINTPGLLFSQMGALAAPRPFLLCNALSDRLYPMPYFNQLVAKIGEIYELYGKRDLLRTATAPGGHADSEAIRLPVYQFFLKQFLGQDLTLTQHGPVDTLAGRELVCYRNGFPTDERLTRIHDEFMPRPVASLSPISTADRKKLAAGRAQELRAEVFNYFPAQSAAPVPAWGEERVIWGRRIREVTFEGFPGLKVTGSYSLPEHPTEGAKLPAVLVVKDEKLPTWFPDVRRSEGYDWGNRAVLAIEVLDNGRRALDDSLRHQMIREANIIGYSFDGMRVYEILRSATLLRGLPEVDPGRIAFFGKKALGVNCLYAGLLDGNIERVIVESPTASHAQGPYYLGILTLTDIPEVAWLMADKLKLIGEVPVEIAEALQKSGSSARWSFGSLAECIQ